MTGELITQGEHNLPEISTPDFQLCKLGESKGVTEKPDK
jgi:hypothetical protein